MQISRRPRLIDVPNDSGYDIVGYSRLASSLLVIWQAQLVERDFILKRAGQSGVATPFGYLQCLLCGFFCLSETAALCESSRKGAQIIGIFAVRKSHSLFSELYCSIPIANRSVRGGCEEPGQIVARHRVLGRDPCCMLVLGDCIFR